ncbi:hypothetical protein BDZ85DRAFT_91715 [Elsinoe ampelina]|uniref:Uncharacterized protein n=1 Tax=Elsinoe ampelina TaxID=302913 RepID=A0A6A6GI46_9PEZI|nr:hypothetical protein BDZ85DRAFT_91715 [Elsinoe ampelina]
MHITPFHPPELVTAVPDDHVSAPEVYSLTNQRPQRVLAPAVVAISEKCSRDLYLSTTATLGHAEHDMVSDAGTSQHECGPVVYLSQIAGAPAVLNEPLAHCMHAGHCGDRKGGPKGGAEVWGCITCLDVRQPSQQQGEKRCQIEIPVRQTQSTCEDATAFDPLPAMPSNH